MTPPPPPLQPPPIDQGTEVTSGVDVCGSFVFCLLFLLISSSKPRNEFADVAVAVATAWRPISVDVVVSISIPGRRRCHGDAEKAPIRFASACGRSAVVSNK